MGLLSRSCSLMRYRVKGEIEGSFWDTIDNGIKQGAFKSLQSSGEDIGLGFTSIEDFTDFEFQGSSYLIANYIALSLRVDTVRVPPRILEMEYKKESRKLIQELNLKRLSSNQRKELKERLKEKLKTQVFPSIQTFDFIWDTSKKLLYFGSHSIKARERLETHFKKCFGLSLIPILAFIRGTELLGTASDKEALDQLKPSSMVP